MNKVQSVFARVTVLEVGGTGAAQTHVIKNMAYRKQWSLVPIRKTEV